MPSSTFNSERKHESARPRVSRATLALLAGAALIFLCAEGAARFGLEQVSRINRRILKESADAGNLREPPGGPSKRMLFVGNSLLLEGVDMTLLNQGLHGRYLAERFVLEQTSYLDWIYGLRKLFRHGMRPGTVVLCLNAPQLAERVIRGDVSAYFLFDVQDIWPAARDAGSDLTTTSGYYLAHYSAFYAERADLRNVLMYRISRPVLELWFNAGIRPATIRSADEWTPIMAARFHQLSDLCARYGSDFVFMVAPTRDRGDLAMLQAGKEAGIRVLRPIPNDALPLDYFMADGLHLNEKGAAVFTQAMVKELRDQRETR
jgi:hypothetical protein